MSNSCRAWGVKLHATAGCGLWHIVCSNPRPKMLVGVGAGTEKRVYRGRQVKRRCLVRRTLGIEKVARFLDREETFVAGRHGGDGPGKRLKERETGNRRATIFEGGLRIHARILSPPVLF